MYRLLTNSTSASGKYIRFSQGKISILWHMNTDKQPQSTHYSTFIVVKIWCYITILILWVLHQKYGCMNHECSQTFWSQNAWKRHESNYTQTQAWQCDESVCQCSIQCQHIFYRPEEFLKHRQSTHGNFDKTTERNRIGCSYNNQYWCKFCREIVWSGKKGLNEQNHQLDHIVKHIKKNHLFIAHWGVVENEYLRPLMPDLRLYAALIMNLILIIAWVLK